MNLKTPVTLALAASFATLGACYTGSTAIPDNAPEPIHHDREQDVDPNAQTGDGQRLGGDSPDGNGERNTSGSIDNLLEASGPPTPRNSRRNESNAGTLERDDVLRVIRENEREVEACYDRGLADDPSLAGDITVRFVVTPDGSVSSATIQSSTLDSGAVEACVRQAVGSWRFPAHSGDDVPVSFPFDFAPGG